MGRVDVGVGRAGSGVRLMVKEAAYFPHVNSRVVEGFPYVADMVLEGTNVLWREDEIRRVVPKEDIV